MEDLIINEFLQTEETTKKRVQTNKKKFWNREEDLFLLDAVKYIHIEDLCKFFNVSIAAIDSRVSRIKKGDTTYNRVSPNPKTKEEMKAFLDDYKNKSKQKEYDHQEKTAELENKSNYEILSAKTITITAGEIKVGGYIIRGSFSIFTEADV